LTSDLVAWSERIRRGDSGRVRIGMIDASAVIHHPHTLRSFRIDRPDVELLLRVAPSADLLGQLAGGQLDVVVCVAPPVPHPGIEIVPLLVEELAVYGPEGESVGDPARWGPWVLFPTGSHTRALIVELLAALGAPVAVVAESHQPDVLREMVRLGTGWTVLPRAQAEAGDNPLRGGRALTDRQLVLARRAGSVADPAVEELHHRLRRDSHLAAQA
jgi:DNA-binding transcriptional LysR family regulator